MEDYMMKLLLWIFNVLYGILGGMIIVWFGRSVVDFIRLCDLLIWWGWIVGGEKWKIVFLLFWFFVLMLKCFSVGIFFISWLGFCVWRSCFGLGGKCWNFCGSCWSLGGKCLSLRWSLWRNGRGSGLVRGS